MARCIIFAGGIEREVERCEPGLFDEVCRAEVVAEDGTGEKDWGLRRLLYVYIDP